jgi:hypothetical protein
MRGIKSANVRRQKIREILVEEIRESEIVHSAPFCHEEKPSLKPPL